MSEINEEILVNETIKITDMTESPIEIEIETEEETGHQGETFILTSLILRGWSKMNLSQDQTKSVTATNGLLRP